MALHPSLALTRGAALDGYVRLFEAAAEEAEAAALAQAKAEGMDAEQTERLVRSMRTADLIEAERWLGRNDLFYLLVFILGRADVNRDWLFARCREAQADPDEVLHLWARYHYKDLAVDTPVLTTLGWKRHGDLAPGDFVFGASGKPTRIVATRHFSDSACRRITFDNDVSFVCGAGHLWTVQATSKARVNGTNRRVGRAPITVETDALAKMRSLYRPLVKATQPLQPTEMVDLPIEPYLFGAWLGDGFSSSGAICGVDAFIFDEIVRRGAEMRSAHYRLQDNAEYRVQTVKGLKLALRALGVLDNKHIPQAYMMASAEQRLALLQGLIDTDGNASSINGCITFAQASRPIAEQVRTLACSLGFKARLTPARTTQSWHVVFQATQADQPCLLPRKLAALPTRPLRPGGRGWRVHSIEPVDTVPTNCIEVDAADGLYLIGDTFVPTHNSSVITFGLTIQEVLCDPDITIAIFSDVNAVARPFLAQIKNEFESNERLKGLYPDVLYQRPETQSPLWSAEKGIIVKRTVNPKEATIEAYGLADGMPTGRHFRLRVYDDLVTVNTITSPEMLVKVTDRMRLSEALGVEGGGGRRRYLGTRYHPLDPYHQLIKDRQVRVVIHAATDNGQEDGAPVFLTRAELTKLRISMGPNLFASQMLLNPAASVVVGFKGEWLRFWDASHWRRGTMNVYIIVDPSSGRKARRSKGTAGGNDFTVMWVIGCNSDRKYYVIDCVRDRMHLEQKCSTLFDLVGTYEPLAVLYEEYGMQADIAHIQSQQDRFNYRFDITPVGGQIAKADRIGTLIPTFEQCRIYLPDHLIRVNAQSQAYNPIQEFIDQEYMRYPMVEHDDGLDALARINDPGYSMVWPVTAGKADQQPGDGPKIAVRGLPLHALHQATRNRQGGSADDWMRR